MIGKKIFFSNFQLFFLKVKKKISEYKKKKFLCYFFFFWVCTKLHKLLQIMSLYEISSVYISGNGKLKNDEIVQHCLFIFNQLQDFGVWLYFSDKYQLHQNIVAGLLVSVWEDRMVVFSIQKNTSNTSKYSVYRSTARFCGMVVFSRQKICIKIQCL